MKYQYDITNFPNKKVDIYSLTQECREKINTNLKYVTEISHSDVEFVFDVAITSNEQTILTSIVLTHQGVQTIKTTEVFAKIKEEEFDGQTQGNFQACVIDLETEGTEVKTSDITFPYPISLFSAEWLVDAEHVGDYAEFHLAPDTVIGAITADVKTGDKIIQVSDTVVENIKRGYHLSVNGSTCFGRVCNVDVENKLLTTEHGSDADYNAGELVKMTIKIVPYWRFTASGFNSVGENKIGSSFIPANTILRLVYRNVNGVNTKKLFGISIDYLY